MEEKKILVSMEYPIYQCEVSLLGTEVKKISGIEGILLALIAHDKKADACFQDELESLFGIPSELLPVFQRSLRGLLGQEIISVSGGMEVQPAIGLQNRIAEFSLTEKGEAAYGDGILRTGDYRESQLEICFDPLSEKSEEWKDSMALSAEESFLAGSMKGKLELHTMMNSMFGTRIESTIDGIIDMEDLFEKNRGKLGIKKEEHFFKGSVINSHLYTRNDSGRNEAKSVTVRLSEGELFADVENEKLRKYFYDYLGAAYLNHVFRSSRFLPEKKFRELKFGDASAACFFHDCSLGTVKRLFLARDLRNMIQKKPSAALVRTGFPNFWLEEQDKKQGKNKKGSKNTKEEENNKKKIRLKPDFIIRGKQAEVICEAHENAVLGLVMDRGFLLYLALRAGFQAPQMDGEMIYIPVVMEIACNEVTAERIVNKLIRQIGAVYNGENARLLACLSKQQENGKWVKDYFAKVFSEEKNFQAMEEMNEICQSVKGWGDFYKEFAIGMIRENVGNVTWNNIFNKNDELSVLKKSAGLSDSEFMKALTKGMDIEGNAEKFYYVFEHMNYQPEDILLVVNLVRRYMGRAVGDGSEEGKKQGPAFPSRLSKEFEDLGRMISALKEMSEELTLESGDYGTVDEEQGKRFREQMERFVKLSEKLGKYRKYAPAEYQILDTYMQEFEAVLEHIIENDLGEIDPDDIDEAYIEELIRTGDGRKAVADMCILLEYELRDYYDEPDVSISLRQLLDRDAEDEELMTGEERHCFHELRQCRNSHLHGFSGKEKNPITVEKLKKWKECLFRFVGGLYEQDGED